MLRQWLFWPGLHTGTSSTGLFLMRLALGLMMVFGHGLPKMQKFAELSETFPDPLGVGSQPSLILTLVAELLCSALIVIGMFTRTAALVLAFTMVVAAFMVHGDAPLFIGPGIESAKEPALLYALPMIALLFTGAGKYSADASLCGKNFEMM
jgi:putative oxidoreductase